jgi:hypothetical protein
VNNFDEFKSMFLKENRKLKLIIAVMLLIFGLGTTSILMQRKYYLYKGKDVFEERPLAVEVCRLGFISLVEGEPNPYAVSEGIIDLVKNEPFKLNLDKVLQLKSAEQGECKIVVKANGKLLAFKIVLEGRDEHPFFYKLNELIELAVDKEIL